jgi:CRP-like cAMP-binding protein
MNTQEKVERLKSLASLHHLTEEKLAELAGFLTVYPFAEGSTVFEEGSTGDTMFFLAEGQVGIEKKIEAGGYKELALLSSGDFFGEMALLEETTRSARARAVTDALLFGLGRDDLERWLRADPRMALGFFVDLLRVFSQRLRGTSQQLVLLYDLSLLTLERFEEETAFLQHVLDRMLPHLEGDWSCAAYLCDLYTGELSRVGTAGPRGEELPETLDTTVSESRWLDDQSYCVALPGKEELLLGFLVAHNEIAMSSREKSGYEVALKAAAHQLSSALQNIRHDREERLRARLEEQRAYHVPL